MKLNITYKLSDMLKALSLASDTVGDAVDRMKQQGLHSAKIVVFETEGMLSTSPFARVTLTHRAVNNPKRWEGYMETSGNQNGPRICVAVEQRTLLLRCSDDYNSITVEYV